MHQMTFDKKPLQYYSKISISISTRAVAADTILTLMFPSQKQYTIITNKEHFELYYIFYFVHACFYISFRKNVF